MQIFPFLKCVNDFSADFVYIYNMYGRYIYIYIIYKCIYIYIYIYIYMRVCVSVLCVRVCVHV